MAATESINRGVKIPAIRVVGMHHWGGHQLALEVPYHAMREPTNQYDPLAVAIKDGSSTKAYVKKDDAAKLARVMDSGFIVGHTYVKFHHPAQVKNKKTGPEQVGNVGFLCRKWHINEITKLLDEVHLDFEILLVGKMAN